MTLDDALTAYTAGLDAELEILRQVESLAHNQRAMFARAEIVDLAGIATRRAELMHQLAAVEAKLEPWRTRIVANLTTARRSAAFPAAESRGQDVQVLVRRLMDHDRRLLTDLEVTLEARRREAHDLETGGATLAAYRRVVAPSLAQAGGLVDSRG